MKDVWKQQDKIEQQYGSLTDPILLQLGWEKVKGIECIKIKCNPGYEIVCRRSERRIWIKDDLAFLDISGLFHGTCIY